MNTSDEEFIDDEDVQMIVQMKNMNIPPYKRQNLNVNEMKTK